MKQTLLAVLLAVFAISSADAQILNRHKRALKGAERRADKALQGGADFVVDPIESVPTRRFKARPGAQAVTNWGEQYLLPQDLKQRLANECRSKVTIKTMDTGEPAHPDLVQGKIAPSNYTTDQTAADGNGHSTHVMGIMGANGFGLTDALIDRGLVAQKAVKILSNSGSGQFTWVQTAIAAERPDDLARIQRGEFVVYNGSFGGGTGLQASVEAELKKSTDAGVVFCFAAGNTSGPGVNYPGNGVYSIACGSLDQGLTWSSYSSYGPQVWAAMPGRGITSTYLNGQYASLSGTSMATPFLTAATAIAFSKWGTKLTGLGRVRAYLAWVCSDLPPSGKDDKTGWGVAVIRNILDKDPANTPGLPNDPPPPPPPSDPPTRETRIINLPIPGEWKVYWSVGAAESRTFKTEGRGSRLRNRAALPKTTTISALQIEVGVNTDVNKAAADLLAETKWFFDGRGFHLLPNSDDVDAAQWALYFYEMLLKTQHPNKRDVDVFGAVGKTSTGSTFVITKQNRRPYPPQ